MNVRSRAFFSALEKNNLPVYLHRTLTNRHGLKLEKSDEKNAGTIDYTSINRKWMETDRIITSEIRKVAQKAVRFQH